MASKEKPFPSYNGGKESDGTFQRIISIMPVHDIYIEPFLGNGAIFRKKKFANSYSIGIDIDTAVIEKWNKSCYGIAMSTHPRCMLINTDAIQWLENFIIPARILTDLGIRILIYCDPPYPINSRKSSKAIYKHEFTEMAHTALLSILVRIGVNVVVSSYPNPQYNDTLTKWHSFTFNSTTRKGTALEKVWYNYTPPTLLHDYRYIGRDYRERERIKGIISREVAKFAKMDPIERNNLLTQLKGLYDGSIRQL